MNARTLAAIAALALVAGCGHATDNTTFAPPPGYHGETSVGPFMQIWQNDKSVMMLFALPVKTDMQNAMSQAQINDTRDTKTDKITICDGKQPAVLVTAESEATTVNGKAKPAQKIEFVATDINGKTYMAMYSRPLNTPADPASEAAIKNVCAKPNP